MYLLAHWANFAWLCGTFVRVQTCLGLVQFGWSAPPSRSNCLHPHFTRGRLGWVGRAARTGTGMPIVVQTKVCHRGSTQQAASILIRVSVHPCASHGRTLADIPRAMSAGGAEPPWTRVTAAVDRSAWPVLLVRSGESIATRGSSLSSCPAAQLMSGSSGL